MAAIASIALAFVAAPMVVESRRPDVTDPDVIEVMPMSSLRDSEVETLVRAAFRNAKEVTIRSAGQPGRVRSRRVTIADRRALDELADRFASVHDVEGMPAYPYPGLEYTQVTFDGPHRADFRFGYPNEIHIGARRLLVSADFCKVVGDALGLEEQSARKR
jgi:hypothetical protein